MKKIVCLLMSVLMLVGCTSNSSNEVTNSASSTSSTNEKVINVYTRDASSGTREAFEKAIDLEELTSSAIEVSSNGDMATRVGKDEQSIGYASLSTDFDANNVKALQFEGVDPTIETVIDGSYKMQRPFVYVTRDSFDSQEKEDLVLAFLDYLCNSTEGMLVVEAAGGIVDVSKGTPWATLAENHPIVNSDNSGLTITTSGSTSVSKSLQAALESFVPLAGNFKFVMNQTGSGDGYKRVLGDEKDGVNAADIGFASRAFKAEEDVTNAIAYGQYAIDAVVTIVHKDNAINNITGQQLKDIYTGTTTSFDMVK